MSTAHAQRSVSFILLVGGGAGVAYALGGGWFYLIPLLGAAVWASGKPEEIQEKGIKNAPPRPMYECVTTNQVERDTLQKIPAKHPDTPSVQNKQRNEYELTGCVNESTPRWAGGEDTSEAPSSQEMATLKTQAQNLLITKIQEPGPEKRGSNTPQQLAARDSISAPPKSAPRPTSPPSLDRDLQYSEQEGMPQASDQLKSVRWIPFSQPCDIRGYAVTTGGFYIYEPPLEYPNYPSPIRHAINTQLQIVEPQSGDDIAFSPNNYEALKPSTRRAFLEWLNEEHHQELHDAKGLGGLYFLHLEHRVLEDGDTSDDMIRCIQNYITAPTGGNGNYLARSLLLQIAILRGISFIIGQGRAIWEQPNFRSKQTMLAKLCALRGAKRLLSAKDAYDWQWAMHGGRKKRLHEKHEELFLALFDKQFPIGVKLGSASPETPMIHFSYVRPSQVLGVISEQRLPGFSIGEETAIINIFEQADKALSCDDGAFVEKPAQLLNNSKIQRDGDETRMKELLEKCLSDEPWIDGTVDIDMTTLRRILGFPSRVNNSNENLCEIDTLLRRIGYCMEPDPTIIDYARKQNQRVCLIPNIGGRIGAKLYTPSHCMVEIFAVIGAKCNWSNDDITRAVRIAIPAAGGEMTTRLEAYARLINRDRSNAVHKVSTIKSFVSSSKLRTALTLLLTETAKAQEVSSSLASAVKQTCADFGVEFSDKMAKAANAIRREDTLFAFHGDPNKTHHDSDTSTSQVEPEHLFALDKSKIQSISAETLEVTSLLQEVMDEEAPEQSPQVNCQQNSAEDQSQKTISSIIKDAPSQKPDNSVSGNGIRALLKILSGKEEWSMAEFRQIAREHDLMPGAAINDINMWADENLGDILITDSGDKIQIDLLLLKNQ